MLSRKLIGAKVGGKGPVAYLVSSTRDSIISVDISDPSNMSVLDEYTSTNLNGAYGVAVDSDNAVAYVACANANCLTSIDISDPSNMSELDSITDTYLNNASKVSLDTVNSIAYVCDNSGRVLVAVDISSPGSLSKLSNTTFAMTSSLTDPIDYSGLVLDPSNDVAYLVNGQHGGCRAIDISNPSSSLSVLSSAGSTNYNGPDPVPYLSSDKNTLYIIMSSRSMRSIINVSNPSAIANTGGASGLVYSGVLDLIPDWANSILFASDSNSDSFKTLNTSYGVVDEYSATSLDGAKDFVIDWDNEVAYVVAIGTINAGTTNALTSIDISNTSSLSELGSLTGTSIAGLHGIALDL